MTTDQTTARDELRPIRGDWGVSIMDDITGFYTEADFRAWTQSPAKALNNLDDNGEPDRALDEASRRLEWFENWLNKTPESELDGDHVGEVVILLKEFITRCPARHIDGVLAKLCRLDEHLKEQDSRDEWTDGLIRSAMGTLTDLRYRRGQQ